MDNRNNNDNNCNDIAYYKSSLIFLYLWIIFLNFMIMGKEENDNIYVLIIIDLILHSFMIYCWGLACTYLIFFFEILIYRFITCNFFSIFSI